MAGQPLEIGEGGLSLLVEKLFPLGSDVNIQYRLGGNDSQEDWVTVRSIVRHAVGKNLGVEFLNLRRQDRLKIVDFVNAAK